MAVRIYQASRDRRDSEGRAVAEDSRLEDVRRHRVGVMGLQTTSCDFELSLT